MRKSKNFSATRGRRCLQVADQIKEELSRLIRFSLKDPRLPDITITDVLLSRDFLSAKVFFVPFARSFDQDEKELVCRVLNAASRFLRKQLYQILEIKHVPALTFFYDDLIDRGTHLCSLIDQVISVSSS